MALIDSNGARHSKVVTGVQPLKHTFVKLQNSKKILEHRARYYRTKGSNRYETFRPLYANLQPFRNTTSGTTTIIPTRAI